MNITELPKVMLLCLLLTIIMEVSAAYIMRVRKKEDFILIVLVNTFTNPILTAATTSCLMFLGKTAHDITEVFLEVTIVIVEGLLYRKTLKWDGDPIILSLVLNAFSFGFGKVISLLIFSN